MPAAVATRSSTPALHAARLPIASALLRRERRFFSDRASLDRTHLHPVHHAEHIPSESAPPLTLCAGRDGGDRVRASPLLPRQPVQRRRRLLPSSHPSPRAARGRGTSPLLGDAAPPRVRPLQPLERRRVVGCGLEAAQPVRPRLHGAAGERGGDEGRLRSSGGVRLGDQPLQAERARPRPVLHRPHPLRHTPSHGHRGRHRPRLWSLRRQVRPPSSKPAAACFS